MINLMADFWESSVWQIAIQVFIIALFIIIGNTLRRVIPFIRKSLLPTSVIAGFLLLILKSVWPWFGNLINNDFMNNVTYHFLGLGFIALALKINPKKEKGKAAKTVFNTGIVTTSGYLVQGIVGLAVTIPLALAFTDLIPASGLILPMGFGQGPGQALNWGTIYETQYGMTGGATFGLSIAALGFLVACLVGVVYLNILKKKGKVSKAEEGEGTSKEEVVSTEGEVPLSDSIDKLTLQIVIISLVYFVTYLTMAGISWICDKGYLGGFGPNTLKPMIWGFNFLLGTAFAVAVRAIMKGFKKCKAMKYIYSSNYLLNRLSGFFFDVMIVAGIAAINIENLKSLWVPLLVCGVLGTVVTIAYLRIIAKHIWPGYEYEAIFSMFGMLTGTASTGMILLREIDPEFKTPAANNLVYQSLPAILFGFPVMLLLSFAPKSTTNVWITFAILIVMFCVYNVILFRAKIFKRKPKKGTSVEEEVKTETVGE